MATKAELQAIIKKLRDREEALEAKIKELKEEIAELTEDPDPEPEPQGHRVNMWISNRHLSQAASDQQPEKPPIARPEDLEWLKDNGVDGLHVITQMPFGPTPSPAHKAVIDDTVKWVNEHPEFTCYYGLHTANRSGLNWTPFAPWFDDANWNSQILPGLDYVAKIVRDSAFAGVTIDGENYGNVRNGWWWANNLGGQTQSQVYAKAKDRGRQVAEALLKYGPTRVSEYFLHLPGSHAEWVQHVINGADPNNYDGHVDPYWVDGLTEDPDLDFTYLDSVFYKASHRGTWDEAYQRNLAGWNEWSWSDRPNVHLAPFIWITMGPGSRIQLEQGINPPTGFDSQRPDDQVKVQLQKASQYCDGPEFAIYEQNSIRAPWTVRPTGTWPAGGPKCCYGGVADALRNA